MQVLMRVAFFSRLEKRAPIKTKETIMIKSCYHRT